MRIAHLTDVHFLRPPPFSALFGKRALGGLNLLLGRARYFDADTTVPRIVSDVLASGPDLVVFTGDLSALSQDAEWIAARAALEPLLAAVPTVILPGNHDRYTFDAMASRAMERHFGPWMLGGRWDTAARRWVDPTTGDLRFGAATFRLGDVDVVSIDASRPSLRAVGQLPTPVLDAAGAALSACKESGRVAVLAMHYPVFDEGEGLYRRGGHCIDGVAAVADRIQRWAPALLLHGHRHHCWRRDVRTASGTTVVLNCGSSSAISPLPDRAAGWFDVRLEGGAVADVRRRVLVEGAPRLVGTVQYPGAS